MELIDLDTNAKMVDKERNKPSVSFTRNGRPYMAAKPENRVLFETTSPVTVETVQSWHTQSQDVRNQVTYSISLETSPTEMSICSPVLPVSTNDC